MSGERIPDWVLERARVGELPEGFSQADLDADPTVPERLEALRKSDAELLERHPPRVVAAVVQDRAQRQRAERRGRALQWVPIAVAAGLMIFIVPVVNSVRDQTDVLTKGLLPHVRVFRLQRNGSAEELADGAVIHTNDTVEVRIVPAGAKFGIVEAVDGTGQVVDLVAQNGLALPQEGPVAVGGALGVDSKARFLRLILVWSDAMFDADPVLAAAKKLGPDPKEPLQLRRRLHQTSFLLVKEP